MTDVTHDRDQAGAELSTADEQVLRELTERARTDGLKLTGEGGLLGRLTKMIIEGAVEGELDDHLGYAKHDPEGRDGGNSRNGYRDRTVITDTGPVEISVPRDRDSSFEPAIAAKRQRRLTGVDDMVISLSAKGPTHGEISAHLAEIYGAEVSRATITAITDRVMEGLADWQSRPLDPLYAVIFIDAINVKIREGQVANRPICLALGVTVDGERDVLGLPPATARSTTRRSAPCWHPTPPASPGSAGPRRPARYRPVPPAGSRPARPGARTPRAAPRPARPAHAPAGPAARPSPATLQPPVTQRDLEAEVANCVGGVSTPPCGQPLSVSLNFWSSM
ncbi:MAG: IS256 family transposase [Streptosporangiaceae bacterium]